MCIFEARNISKEQAEELQDILDRMKSETDEEKLKRLLETRDTYQRRVRSVNRQIRKIKNRLGMRRARKDKLPAEEQS